MAYYMYEVAYSHEAWAAMVHHPQNRRDIIAPVIERAGGRIESFYLAFGENDAVVIVEVPDDVTAASLAMAASASGSVERIRTVPLMTMEQGVEAMRKAADSEYLAPSRRG